MMERALSCRKQIEWLIQGELERWRGLGECGPADIVAVCGPPDKETVRGLSGIPTLYRHYPCENLGSGLDVWFEEERVILIEIPNPPLSSSIVKLLEVLGSPEKILDEVWPIPHHVVLEHVYASRGLTLSVATPYNVPEAKPDRIVHLRAYKPGEVNNYISRFGMKQGKKSIL